LLVVARPFAPDPEADAFRATSQATIEILEPQGPLSGPPRVARWEAWKGDPGLAPRIEYRFQVVRDDGGAVAERLLPPGSEPLVEWPSEATGAGRYTWSVEALVDGERVARSRLVDLGW
jgi:hypothetical protein